MQRTEPNGGVVISCDFCGTDWDEVLSMIEGHHGSILCLECFKRAHANLNEQPGEFQCTSFIRENLPQDLPRWKPDALPAHANAQAIVCADCIRQAARTFDRDQEVDWKLSP